MFIIYIGASYWKDLDEQDLIEFYLVRFGFRMWEILIMSTAENSNKFQKTRFWNEKSVQDVVTLGANSTCHTNLHKKM